MPVYDEWKGLSKAEMAAKRKPGANRWLRRWRDGTRLPSGRLKEFKQYYPDHQKIQAELDDAKQRADPKASRIARNSVTVRTLLDRHLKAKGGAKKTREADAHHAQAVLDQFGDRVFSTITFTEVQTWVNDDSRVAARTGKRLAQHSRKKQLEILRAAIKRGIKDKLIDEDPTEGIAVSLGHREKPHLTSEELLAVLAAASSDLDRALLSVLGLMGPRSGEAISLKVGDLLPDGRLSVLNSGAESDQTKTRQSRRYLPVPKSLLPLLEDLAGDRPKNEWLFASPRKKGQPVGDRYAGDALTRAIARANQTRTNKVKRIGVHGLRHTFAYIALSELRYDILTVSHALGHSKPSTTLNEYGHWAPNQVGGLMDAIDSLLPEDLSTQENPGNGADDS